MSAMIAWASQRQTCARRFRNARICSFARHRHGTRTSHVQRRCRLRWKSRQMLRSWSAVSHRLV